MPTLPLLSLTDVEENLFSAWLEQAPGRTRERGCRARAGKGVLRFAFYGRTSTGRFQDPATSRQWQLDTASRAIDGVGRITVEFFDVGCSRSLPWRHRPRAAALLAAAAGRIGGSMRW